MRRILKILFYIAVCLCFVVVATIGVTQTALFRNWLKRTLLSKVNAAINGELRVGEFSGNLFLGLTIDSVSLRIDGDDFIRAERVDLRYKPLALLRKTISFSELTIYQPVIRLLKSKDGRWNVERLAKEKAEGGGTFDWAMDISDLEIRNGQLAFVDSSNADRHALQSADSLRSKEFDFGNLHLSELNLALAGFVDSDTKDISLQHLSFLSATNSFHLKNLSGNFYVDKKRAGVTDFDLETDSSHVQLSCSLSNVSLLEGITLGSLKEKKVHLDFAAKRFSFEDLKRFLPELDFLNGTATLGTSVDGKFGDFAIKRLEVQTGHSDLTLSGTMKNLHKPDRLFIDVNFAESIVQPEDVNMVLPKLQIPDFSPLGKVRIKLLEYRGEPLNFTTKVDAMTDCGAINADAHLDVTSRTLRYDGTVAGSHVDAAKITGDENLSSNLNFAGTIQGSGTTLEDLNTTLKIQIDTSEVLNQSINQSQLTVEAKDRSVNAFLALFSNPTQVYLKAGLTSASPDNLSYSLDGSVVSLDISKFIGEAKYASDLTMKVSGQANGEDLDDLSGTMDVKILPSTFRGRRLKQTDLQVSLSQRNPRHKSLSIDSDVADVAVQGSFDIRDVARIIRTQAVALAEAIRSKLISTDSTEMEQPPIASAKSQPESPPRLLTDSKSDVHGVQDFSYRIKFKDLTSLAVFLGNDFVDARGDADGAVTENRGKLLFKGTVNVGDFYWADTSTNILLQNGRMTFQLDNITADNLLADLKTQVRAEAQAIYLGNTVFDNARLQFDYADYVPTVRGRVTVDSQLTVEIGGSADLSGDIYPIKIDKLLLNYRDYRWENSDTIVMEYGRSGLEIAQCDFSRGSEHIRLVGEVKPKIDHNLRLSIRNMRLGGMQGVLSKKGEASLDGILNLQADITGNYREPIINIDIAADSLTYSDISLGRCTGKIHYAERKAEADLSYDIRTAEGEQKPSLTFSAAIPIDLSLVSVEDRLIDSSMNVSIRTNNFPLAILNPLLPGVRDVKGIANGDIHITGTLSAPQYGGYVTIKDGQFLFEANNMLYLLSATIEPRGDTIHVVNLELRNDPRDKSDGLITVTGDIGFKRFEMNYFDLTARGQLLALKESSRKVSRSVYGDLAIALGDTGLRYSGSFENSLLRGTVLLTQGNMIFPPAESGPSFGVSRSNFVYAVIDDTTKFDSTQKDRAEMRALYAQNVSSRQNKIKRESSLLKGLNYDLAIETQRDIQALMIFNSLTGEELLARLNGRIFLLKVGQDNLFFGDVNIADQSVFKFWYRKLDASGTLRFNGDLGNPELSIQATYKGFHTDTTHGALRNQQVVVTATITGTKELPKLSWSMTIDGEQRLGYVESDALSFIMTGKFERELTSGERQNMAVNFSDLGYSSVSSMLSGKLTDLLRNELGIIKSVEYQYSGGDILQGTQLSVSGDIGRTGAFRLGGRIFNDINSTNVNIEFPLGEIFQTHAWRNLYLELERKATSLKPGEERETSTYGARIYYRIAF